MNKVKVRPKAKVGECVYCGKHGHLTDDHAPPRSFYPFIPPKDLIVVPCCGPCNLLFSKEDDYVRMILTVDERTRGNADRNQILPAVERYLSRKESARQLTSFFDSIQPRRLHLNPNGLYTWSQSYMVDGSRLDRFATRITKAIFYREKGYRLPNTYAVNAIHVSKVEPLAAMSSDNRDFLEFIGAELISARPRVWGDVFTYWFVQSPNEEEQTWWLLAFYQNVQYICNTWKTAD